jgi:cytochrome c peroxidase
MFSTGTFGQRGSGIIAVLVMAFFSRLTLSKEPQADELRSDAKAVFGKVDSPAVEAIDQPLVHLGHRLFWDERLSANGKIACASCHAASAWGADTERYSLDAKGKLTKRNSQTVFNAMLQPGLRWTADRKSGAHQAERSLTGSMGFAQAEDVTPMLEKNGYEPLFKIAFPNQENRVTPANYAKAIEAYEATLTTPAAFDRYLAGDNEALSAKQKEGLRLFMAIGCSDCHSGKLLGGEELEKFGVHADYWTLTNSQVHDEGLFESTKEEEDKFSFRVSMLRNIEKTGPYFHDGSVGDLKEAIRIMAQLQLGEKLGDGRVESIAEFLKSLTGEVPKSYTKPEPVDLK